MDHKNSLSPETKAVLDAIDYARWVWGNASSDVIAVVTLRAVVKELKYYGITEKNILRIADEIEGKTK